MVDPEDRGGERSSSDGGWDWGANLKTIGGAVLLAFFIRIVLFEAFEIEGPSMEPTLLSGDRVVVAKFLYGLFLPLMSEAAVSWGEPDAGDVVIVRSPEDEIDIVKRVVGLPGDTIAMRDHVVYRNGEPVPHEVVGDCQPSESSDVQEPVEDVAGRRSEDGVANGAPNEFDRFGGRLIEPSYGFEPGKCVIVRETLDGVTYYTSRRDTSDRDIAPTVVGPGEIFILGDHRDRSNDSGRLGPIPIDRVKGRALFIYWSSFYPPGDDGWTPTLRWDRLGESVQ